MTDPRPCSSCGRSRAECRTLPDPFLSCCTTCAANDGDTHRATATAAPARDDDPPLTDEHVDAVVMAARLAEPIVMSLDFVISRGGTGCGAVLSGGAAWRYIVKHILQADREVLRG